MKIVVGLGNPGSEYSQTRHNVGFMAIDAWAAKHGVVTWKNKFEAQIAEIKINNEQVILVKPQTYMNLSGVAVAPIVKWYKAQLEDVIIIYDDMDTTLGKIRLRKKGSAGGHNGLKSIIQNTGTQNFLRLRIGVGKLPENGDMVKHVLGRLKKDDRIQFEETLENVPEIIGLMIKGNVDEAMNRFN